MLLHLMNTISLITGIRGKSEGNRGNEGINKGNSEEGGDSRGSKESSGGRALKIKSVRSKEGNKSNNVDSSINEEGIRVIPKPLL